MPKQPTVVTAINPLYKGTTTEKLWELVDHLAKHNPDIAGSDVSFVCDKEHFKLKCSANVSLIGVSITEFSVRVGDESTTIVYYPK